MLLHSPRAILSKKKIIDNKLIDKMNLILSGHNHGGLTPTWIQDLFNNHIGFFGAYRTILEKHAYGIFKKNKTYLLISNGITKVSKSSPLGKVRKLANRILLPEIDIITFKKDYDNNLKLDKRRKYE